VHSRLADQARPSVPDPVVRKIQSTESAIDGQSGCKKLGSGIIEEIVGQVERYEALLNAVLTLKRLGDAGDTLGRHFVVAGFGV
jgi:hypothetical protein